MGYLLTTDHVLASSRSDSRIPDTMFGTAEEDAFRRDFTLNALFYNVNEGKVEDLTGRSGGKHTRPELGAVTFIESLF